RAELLGLALVALLDAELVDLAQRPALAAFGQAVGALPLGIVLLVVGRHLDVVGHRMADQPRRLRKRRGEQAAGKDDDCPKPPVTLSEVKGLMPLQTAMRSLAEARI